MATRRRPQVNQSPQGRAAETNQSLNASATTNAVPQQNQATNTSQESQATSPRTLEFLRAGLHVSRQIYDTVQEINQATRQPTVPARNDNEESPFPIKLKMDVDNITSSIPVCDGSCPEQLIVFMQEIQNILDSRMLPEDQLLYYLIGKTSEEFRFWWSSKIQGRTPWNMLKIQILNTYLSATDIILLTDKLVQRVQREDESFSQFIRDIIMKATVLNLQIPELQLINMIWAHVNRNTFNYIKYRSIPTNLDALRQTGLEIAQIQRREQQFNMPVSQNLPATSTLPNQFCNYCKRSGHNIQECRRRQQKREQPAMNQERSNPKN